MHILQDWKQTKGTKAMAFMFLACLGPLQNGILFNATLASMLFPRKYKQTYTRLHKIFYFPLAPFEMHECGLIASRKMALSSWHLISSHVMNFFRIWVHIFAAHEEGINPFLMNCKNIYNSMFPKASFQLCTVVFNGTALLRLLIFSSHLFFTGSCWRECVESRGEGYISWYTVQC